MVAGDGGESIRTDALSKSVGKATILEPLTLSVAQGEIFGLLGPNGAGKTTLMRLLLGLARPTSGRQRILGHDGPPNASVLSRIGATIEEPGFYPWKSGRANLEIAALTGAAGSREWIEEALDAVGLSPHAGAPVKSYSQGMRQRLALAVAIMRTPQLLILDEPANGLDPDGMAWLRELLRASRDRGATVLVSSHLLHDVERVCDRVAVLHRGRLVAVGRPDEVGAVSGPRTSLESRFQALTGGGHAVGEG